MNRSGKLHALLATARVANVPSVVSNVWVGVAAAHFAAMLDSDIPLSIRVPFWEASRLALTGICLYVSGNFLNDWMDRDWDAAKRPERALPAGLFQPGVYLAVAVLLAVLGMALATTVNGSAAMVAGAIVLSVVIYTWCHKITSWSVIPMGLCRALLPVMGVAGISQTGQGTQAPSALWSLAFGTGLAVFCYIVGLSLSARSESVEVSSRDNKILSVIFLILAPLLMMIPGYLKNEHPWIWIIAPMAYLGWIALTMTRFRKPVSRHVSALLAGIPLVDWIFLLPLFAAPFSPFGIACAIIPLLAFVSALLLQRLAPGDLMEQEDSFARKNIVSSGEIHRRPTIMPACELKPEDKKQFISDVGRNLVREHGKKKYYKPEQIRKAAIDGGYQPDIVCWAYVMFSSPADFVAIHEAAGEACDYAAMKAEVLTDLASGDSFLGIDLDLSWLEWPDIDLSSVFDWFDLP